MRRFGVALAAALSATALVAAPATAEPGPPCSDVVGGTALWNGNTLEADLLLKAPACRHLTYTLYYTTTDPNSTTTPTFTELTVYTVDGSSIEFSTPLAEPTPDAPCDEFVWVYATTSTKGHTFDRAPDAGYIVLANSTENCGSPGQVFH